MAKKPSAKPAPAAAATPAPIDFFLSPLGNDRWSGRLPAPNAKRTDGPFATVPRAQKAARQLKVKGELPSAVRILFRAGTYELAKPITLTPADSGSPPPTDNWHRTTGPERGITYAAYPGEKPVLSGGRRITGFKPATIAGREAWVVTLPEVRTGKWFFTQLWVNGRRATRPRLPKAPRSACFRIAELLGDVVWEGDVHKVLFTGQDQFRAAPGDLQPWRNATDIEFVALHFWIESRINFASIDPAAGTAKLQWKSRMRLTDDFSKVGAPYYIENIFEALDSPGQWYLDRPTGRLYYLPRPGETIATAQVYAPRLDHVVSLRGDQHADKPVERVHFRGLTFSHTEWTAGEADRNATPQAACHVPGAIRLHHARQCSLESCTVTHVGTYGIEIDGGSIDISVLACAITDLGGGGVKVWHSADPEAPVGPAGGTDQTAIATCRRITLADNEIADGGHRYHQAVGVLIGRCPGNLVLHNHIHNFDYTGISVGWCWGYAESLALGNVIEHNYVHDIGRGMLSDMGGIYTLGVSTGTRIRFNTFHDIESRGYGGWAIYTDEGSSNILIESNLAYRTKSQGFHQHYGRDNIIRNNIFAFGREAQFARSRLEPHDSFAFTRNIILADNDGQMLVGDWSQNHATVDHNLYFHRAGKPLRFKDQSWQQWRKRGLDRHGLIADPLFKDAEGEDFTLRPGSPAAKIGFQAWDISDVGPRRTPGA